MAKYLSTQTTSSPWTLNINGAGEYVLQTAEKFLDRNINVEVPQGTFTATSDGGLSTENGIVQAVLSGTLSNRLLTTKPAGTDGTDYLTILADGTITTAPKASFSGTVTPVIETAGYIDAGKGASQDFTAEEVEISTAVVKKSLYLPIKTLTEDNLTLSHNYITGQDGDTSAVDKVTITLSGVEDGYYIVSGNSLSKTFENILPDSVGTDQAAYILSGYKAYDANGQVILGTLPNMGKPDYIDAPITLATTSDAVVTMEASGSSGITFGTTGIAIKATATMKPTLQLKASTDGGSTIQSAGYWLSSSYKLSDEQALTADATKYISEISVATGETLSKLTNNGTITTLNGTGTISTLEGTQTINELRGILNIKSAVDADSATSGSAAKLVWSGEGSDITLVQDGHLITGVLPTTITTQTTSYTTGWYTAGSMKVRDAVQTSSCAATDPSITYFAQKSDASSVVLNTTGDAGYAIVVGGTATAGSHQSSITTTTAGWIGAGTVAGNTGNINITGSTDTETYYLNKITFSKAYSGALYGASEDGNRVANAVNQTYWFKASEGYNPTDNLTVGSVTVYDGEFTFTSASASNTLLTDENSNVLTTEKGEALTV